DLALDFRDRKAKMLQITLQSRALASEIANATGLLDRQTIVLRLIEIGRAGEASEDIPGLGVRFTLAGIGLDRLILCSGPDGDFFLDAFDRFSFREKLGRQRQTFERARELRDVRP